LLLFLGGGILIGASAGGTVGAGVDEANIDEKMPIYLYR
jgi:hypothetical protein